MTEVIAIENLTHSYQAKTPVLDGVTLSVARGEIVAVIGLSGAGKSTLLRCVNGLVKPTGGTCRVFDTDVAALSESGKRLLRRRIGMIFQEFNLVDRSSVLTNVLIGRLAYVPTLASCFHRFPAQDVALASACLAQVGLAGYEKRWARALSGGQKQRVAIARAMAQEAQLILADEATANLDARTKTKIMEIIQDVARQRQAAVLLSMHDIELARTYCTRIVGLRQGRITFDSPASEVSEADVDEVLRRNSAGEQDDET
ncbi:MAG: phosphonate ABC transporter ATP-binding protein [Capsulimonadaceae bacterium]|nr:phosphonate ABC transporter ATP-binding protein [Capsulimonadaceae bacterium]